MKDYIKIINGYEDRIVTLKDMESIRKELYTKTLRF